MYAFIAISNSLLLNKHVCDIYTGRE